VAKEMREFAAYVENMGKLGKKLLTPAGSQVDKPKHSKAHKIDFCGLFCFKRSSKKSPILNRLVSRSGAAALRKFLLTRTHRRGSLSRGSTNEHLDSAKTSKEIY